MKAVLDLEGWPIAIKLLRNSGELSRSVKEIDEAHRHCEMIQKVRIHGISFLAPLSKQRCKVAATSLGLMKPSEELRRHQLQELFYERHRFKTEELLWKFLEDTPQISEKYSSVLYAPLGSIIVKPDVVVIICNPLQAMKVLQAYQYLTGQRANFSLGGLFSLCADGVSTPYLTGRINLAIGCEGARKHARLKDYELLVGIPYRIAEDLSMALQTLANYENVEEEHVQKMR
jgi:uncharacterized protein (DUF169 family)